jgi:hypothetical protein
LSLEHLFDIFRAIEYAFEIHVPHLQVLPRIEDNRNVLETSVPDFKISLVHFVIRTVLRATNIIDMLVNLGNKVIPPLDQRSVSFRLISRRFVISELEFLFFPSF